MGLFSKKKEETSMLPDLPVSNEELPNLPDYGSSNANLNSDVPVNNIGAVPNGNPQEAIKNEIHGNLEPPQGNLQKSQFEPLPHYDSGSMPARIVAEPGHVMEAHEQEHHQRYPQEHQINHEMTHEPKTIEMPSNMQVRSSVKSARPVYIRLDKFKAGLQSFEDIKGKLTEIEDLLVKIRETKEKEERELEEWEREIQVAKARIEQIDNDVFRNVE